MSHLGEGFFEALFERQGDAVIVADDDARIVHVNRAACAMLGRTREELETLAVADIVVEDVPDETQRLWGRFREASQQRGRIRLRCAKGEVVTAEYVATAGIGDGLHVSVLRDDLRRHRDELVLRLMTDTTAAIDTTLDPEEIMRRVVQAVVDHVADWAAGDLRSGADALRRVAIAHHEGALEDEAWRVWNARSVDTGPIADRVLATGEMREVAVDDALLERLFSDTPMRRDAQRLGIERVLVVPIPSRRTGRAHGLLHLGQGRSSERPLYEGLQGAAQDLARRVGAALDRARAYEDLRLAYERSEEQRRILDAIMTNVPEGITIAEGPDVQVRMISRFGLESLGLDPDAALGSTTENHPEVFRVVDPETGEARDPATLPLRRAITTGEPVVNEQLTVERTDGYRAELLANAAPIRDAGGKVTGGVLAWRDVTPLMDVERKLDEALRGEREARRAAEEASRLKDQFLGTVSHELRTPLNAVLGWAQILRSPDASRSEVEHGLAVIERNAQAQKQLIDDLLDVSRIVSGNIRLELAPVQLEAALETVLASLGPAADERGVELRRHVEDDLPPVLGDVSRLQQVISNLVSNAIKFTPRGGHVQVGLERSNGGVRLTVEDDGAGIEPSALPSIFDRFRQAEGGSTRRHGGLGLGLAIVKELVDLHGGSVRARSEGVGKGACFVVELPVRPVSRPGERPHPDTDPGLTAPRPRLADLDGIRVLLVEDDPDSRALVARVLRRAGAEVQEEGSARDALSSMDERLPDVVVSDIGMPTMDGLELIRRIRRMDLPRQPPAIALTAYASSRDRDDALHAGYQVHLTKPVEAAQLASTVRDLAMDAERES